LSKVVKGIGKAVKKVLSSKIGKALLIAATIYIGGAALGAWQSPFTSINGALAGGAKASTGVQMAASGEAAAAAGTAANSVGPLASGYAGASAPAAAGSAGLDLAALSSVPGITPAAAATPTAAASTTTALSASPIAPATNAQKLGSMVGKPEAVFGAAEAPKGIISKIMSGAQPAMDFMVKNPLPTAMMLGAAGSAAAPDEIDMIREQKKQEDKERVRREKNLDIAGIDINMRASKAPLMDNSGNPVYDAGGIINRARTGGVV